MELPAITSIPQDLILAIGYIVVAAFIALILLRKTVGQLAEIANDLKSWFQENFIKAEMKPLRDQMDNVIDQQRSIINSQERQDRILGEHSISIAILQGKVFGGVPSFSGVGDEKEKS